MRSMLFSAIVVFVIPFFAPVFAEAGDCNRNRNNNAPLQINVGNVGGGNQARLKLDRRGRVRQINF